MRGLLVCEEMAWPNRRYSTGSRTRVSASGTDQSANHHDGSGRWISSQATGQQQGHRPKAVMEAVISTGRNRRSEPSRTTCSMGRPSACRWLKMRHQHQSVEHGDAQQRDEADRRRHRQVLPRQPQRRHAADHGKRHVAEDERGLPHRAEGHANSTKKISPRATGTTMPRRAAARCWFSNRSPHSTR